MRTRCSVSHLTLTALFDPKQSTKGMEDLNNILSKLLGNNKKLRNGLHVEELKRNWATIVGNASAKQSWVIHFYNDSGVLLLGTASPTWAYHLRFLENEIRDRVNEFLIQNYSESSVKAPRVTSVKIKITEPFMGTAG